MTILPSQEHARANSRSHFGFGWVVAFACCAMPAFAQSTLKEVRNVYLLPMPGGLEQYIALQLSQHDVLQVVTDPKKADVVLTDRIGGDFEDQLAELYAAKEVKVESGKVGSADFSNQHMRPLSRSHGAVFLVDRHSGDVLWSTAETPKSTQASDLRRAADHIVSRLSDARSKAGKQK
jgi:hypothetical protein